MRRLFKNGLLDLPLRGVWGPRRLKMEALNALKQGWNTAKEAAGWAKHSAANILGKAILLLPVIFILALVLVPLKTPPFTLLPEANQAGALLEVWPESHWPGFALRKADVFQSDMA